MTDVNKMDVFGGGVSVNDMEMVQPESAGKLPYPVKKDAMFKGVFANPKRLGILSDFLSTVLDLGMDELKSIRLSDTNIPKSHIEDKLSILDVYVETMRGDMIDVELQLAETKTMRSRIVYYLSKLLAQQLVVGDGYKLNKAIGVVITDFNMLPEQNTYCCKYQLLDRNNTSETLTDILEVNVLELKKLPETDDENTGLLDWLRFIKAERWDEMEALAKKNPKIEEAVEVVRTLSTERSFIVEAARLEYAKVADLLLKAEAREDGREEGMARGREEERLQCIRNAKVEGLPVDMICRLFNTTPEEVEDL